MTHAATGDSNRSLVNWRDRVVPPAQALSGIRPGDRIFVGSACATPRTLVAAIKTLECPPADIQLVHFLTDGAIPLSALGSSPRYRHRVFFIGSNLRDHLSSDRVEYVPISISQVRQLIDTGGMPIDAVFVQVSPPDAEGRCSLGVSVDLALTAVDKAKTVIAEINPAMPKTRGNTRIPLDKIDALVEVNDPVTEYLHEPADELAQQIARYVARIVDDGSTLQIGLGRVPNEMLAYLTNRRDLGIHSDVVTEALVDLIRKGVVTGKEKTLHPGQVVASYCMGTKRLYDLVDDNPQFNFQPIEYVCDPAVIASNDRMISVTQAFAMDLTGQVCADQFEGKFYGGVSSQPDFLRGASSSPGGKAIICLASTTDDGMKSRIRPLLQEGEGVTIARSEVHYVVTEYGMAYLFGKSIRERAVAMIEIAHPDFRESLLEEAKRLAYVPSYQKISSRKAYPEDEERVVSLADGAQVLIRPSRASDIDAMQELFYSLPEKDIVTRFFTNLESLSADKALHLCNVSYEQEMAFVAVHEETGRDVVIGSSCYYVDPANRLADVAYMIHPQWQGKGLGSFLQRRMMEYAMTKDLRGFKADVLCDNTGMLAVFEKSGCSIRKKVVSGTYEIVMLFE